ncbi:ATP-binding protein [Streptomyces virginiae]|uniref:ATP-binding protein n=1 Tax=Streptomyces virginiae TaxID=1961 RepID=UPI00224F9B4E|nr:ATP-binding protein [Streptomyces virginiae]MCX4721865.1 ATP-binding protein [Streptomyces virginiae]
MPRIWSLPHRPESAATARRIATAVLHEWGVDDETIDEVLLVVSELVTNALEHALPPVVLHLQWPANDATLSIEVDDGGPADDAGAWAANCTPEEHGRGAGIIGLLASAHGTRVLPHAVTYWAALPAVGSRQEAALIRPTLRRRAAVDPDARPPLRRGCRRGPGPLPGWPRLTPGRAAMADGLLTEDLTPSRRGSLS